MSLHWDQSVFRECYDAIRVQDEVPTALIAELKPDLLGLLAKPARNDSSRNKLAVTNEDAKIVTLNNGEKFKFNKSFIESAFLVSVQLDLDELASAELLSYVSSSSSVSIQDSAKLAFFNRYNYILNIVGYLVESKNLHLISSDYASFFTSIISSLSQIYTAVDTTNDLVDKQKVTSDINNNVFVDSVLYVKQALWSCHELLASVLYSFVTNYSQNLDSLDCFTKLVAASKKLAQNDVLILHYMPALFRLLHNVESNDSSMAKLYTTLTSTINTDYQKLGSSGDIDLSQSSISSCEVVLYLLFFTRFIEWCKDLESRTAKYDFKKDIVKYINILINYGAMELLLCVSAATARNSTQKLLEWNNLYDFRSLLQKSFPSFLPVKFAHSLSQEFLKSGLSNASKLGDNSVYTVSSSFSDSLFAPFLHEFYTSFITNAAVILTSLRDHEEDFLLSSINRKELESKKLAKDDELAAADDYDQFTNSLEKMSRKNNNVDSGLDLDEISIRSDLERFYLSFVYMYNDRPEFSQPLWEENELDITGLIHWGLSNNTSPLISATFCLVLGALASGNGDISCRIWEILANNNSSSLKKNDYSKISIDSIVDSLNYYLSSLVENFEIDLINQVKQQQKKQEFLFSSLNGDVKASESDKVVIELSEDSVVFISGFVQLILALVKNLSADVRGSEIKSVLFSRFSPIIQGFFKFDNLIMSSQNVQFSMPSSTQAGKMDTPNVIIDEGNRTILTNLVMNLVGAFVDDNLPMRYKLWELIDRWLCHALTDVKEDDSSGHFKLKYQSKKVKVNQGLQTNLTHLSQVGNFVELMKKLLTPLSDSSKAFKTYDLLYPADLGASYRPHNSIGVWPYIEYLLMEVFAKSQELTDLESRCNIQSTILDIANQSLTEIDWPFIGDVAPQILPGLINFDNLVDSSDARVNYNVFVKLHHSLAVINYFFEEKAYSTLFKIINLGNDKINDNERLALLVHKALTTVDEIIYTQKEFFNTLLPILKNRDQQNQSHNRPSLGTTMSLTLVTSSGFFDNLPQSDIRSPDVGDFFEVLLFNLTCVANLALYVGSSNLAIASLAVKILGQVSNSSFFKSTTPNSLDPLLNRNRLLTIFESLDESEVIRYSFVQQLDDLHSDLKVKFNILSFLNDNLSLKDISSSHFLLGFEIRGGVLRLDDKQPPALLQCLLKLLNFSLWSLSEIDYSNGRTRIVDVGPGKLSSLILEILVKLCRGSISSAITLDYLRKDSDLFDKLVQCQPQIDAYTVWHKSTFNGDLSDETANDFVSESLNLQAFLSFINHRNLVLQYLSLEFHGVESLTKKNSYIDLLLNGNEFLDGSPKILKFLDILNYSFYNFESYKYEQLSNKYKLSLIVEKTQKEQQSLELTHEPILSKIYKLVCCNGSKSLITQESKMAFAAEVMEEANKIDEFLTKYLISSDVKHAQLSCLHSWVQVIQVLISDGAIQRKSDFILEILQLILPKINDYYEHDILFAEELISLCVLLFDAFEQENESVKEDNLPIDKLIPLFKTCISGIVCSNSTPGLRADLYILSNKFLHKIFGNKSLVQQVMSIFRTMDRRFIDIITNDSIYSEGAPRITSIILLESLVHLSSSEGSDFILDLMIRNNSLLLLVRSIKRTDETLSMCQAGKEGVSVETLLYELTAFKCTLYLLVRVAQTRVGAPQLIQNELFPILKQLQFLQVDPDLGLDIKLSVNDVVLRRDKGTPEPNTQDVTMNLSLDIPLRLAGKVPGIQNRDNTVSYYEFLVPVFHLVTAVLLSMGPSYKPSICQTKDLMEHFNRLIVGVVKRDMLIETLQLKLEEGVTSAGLKELVKQFTLLDLLVK